MTDCLHLSVFEQSEIFEYAFLFGVALALFYDFFRLIRAMGINSCKAVFLQDIIFMSVSSVLCFLFAQVTVHGYFRFFVIFAHAAGFAC